MILRELLHDVAFLRRTVEFEASAAVHAALAFVFDITDVVDAWLAFHFVFALWASDE